MTWDQAQQLADSGAGLTIGSHAQATAGWPGSTRMLSTMSWPARSRSWRARLGRPIKALAYPYGWPGTLYRLDQGSGRASWLSAWPFRLRRGSTGSPGLDRYEISRLGVGSADSAALLRARSVLHGAFGKSFL